MKPKILILDIETAPILGYVWGLFDQNVALNQIHADWHLMSYGAKWLDSPKVMYRDQRKEKDISDDSGLASDVRKLLNEADIVVGQNSKRFDIKKINARLVFHGHTPPAPYKQIDTLELAKKHFGFTSNKLEYMSNKLNTKYKKLSHAKYPGFELWKQCLAGNQDAWREMEKYNKHDVLATEELYKKLAPWGTGVNFRPITGTDACSCGATTLQKRGYSYTTTGKFHRYQCTSCGSWSRGAENLAAKGMKR